jgi:hypothetical protein
LNEVDEAFAKESGGEFRVGIDEDADTENAVLQSVEEGCGGFRWAVALGLWPEVDAKSRDAESGELLGIVRNGDAADLEGRRGGVEEAVEKGGHGGRVDGECGMGKSEVGSRKSEVGEVGG